MLTPPRLILILALLAGSAILSPLSAQAFTPLTLTRIFDNPTPEDNDLFGSSVSLSGTNALIGAALDNTGATSAGSAYLFDTVTGNLLQTFNNPTPEDNDFFGFSVSLSGTNALIGAFGESTRTGSAYLFDTVTGNLLRTFNNPTPEDNDWFGSSVLLSGSNALIGALFDNTGATNAGSAYLFDTVTGNLLQTFNNPAPQDNDTFGFGLSLVSTNALIGSCSTTGCQGAPPPTGGAYLFDTATGDLLQTFDNPNPQEAGGFGESVSLSGTNALIGAFNTDAGVTDAGAAYLFDTVTGNLLRTFSNPDPKNDDRFGGEVNLNGNIAFIRGSAPRGIGYLYDIETGDLLQTINTPTPGENQQFAISSSWDGDNLLLGDSGIGKALLYGIAPGGSPDDPILPDIIDDTFVFNFAADPNQTYYIDPDVAIGYDYTVTGGPLFASVELPTLAAGDNIYNLFADTSGGNCSSFGDTGITIAAGDVFNFASPTNCFGIRGIEIEAGLDPTDVTAFVTGVTFDVLGTVTVTQTPIVQPVPEPLTLLGASAAVAFGAAFKRRRQA
ncbi:MAG: PEP-CTERM sorting domain-containing protein [Cyanobacteriota bacterium]|nr:PEP-CTERM sorting domain-containing protein [Cyanobacteriota bacterium]